MAKMWKRRVEHQVVVFFEKVAVNAAQLVKEKKGIMKMEWKSDLCEKPNHTLNGNRYMKPNEFPNWNT